MPIFVYLENYAGISSYLPILYFDGTYVEDLVVSILDFLQANTECLPVVEVYSARSGVSGRVKLEKKIPSHLESVYVLLK